MKKNQPTLTARAFAILVLLAAGLFSCSSGEGDILDLTQNHTILVAGKYNNRACLWVVKGLVKFRLDLSDRGFTPSEAMKVVSRDGNVYISGYASDNMGIFYPCMWINGVRTDFQAAITEVGIPNGFDISVYKGVVYVAGHQSPVVRTACYWINGIPCNLDTGGTTSTARAIYVDGGIHIAGDWAAGQPCYWYNGMRVSLPYPGFPGFLGTANCIKKRNGAVFISGSYNPGSSTACMWLNGSFVELPSIGNSSASDFEIVDGNLITVGLIGTPANNAYAWINYGQQIQNYSGGNVSRLNSIYANRNILLVSGQMTSGSDYACLWYNGVKADLDTGVAGTVGANSINVVE